MIYLQIAANGLVLGGLYACIAVGFSLVWGVLNVINILHGTFIVLGSYVAYFAYVHLGIHPFVSIAIAGGMLYVLGHALQAGIINRVVTAPVLITLTLTFGLDLILNNAMLVAFTADYRGITLAHPFGSLEIGPVFLPGDRVAAMALAIVLTLLLYRLLRDSKIGRAIVAVRMDREAAALMGVDIKRINAITFGIGAFMAGAAGALLSIIFPISPAQQPSLSRQGLRRLRARRARQRSRRSRRRACARGHRELRLLLARSRARSDAVARPAAPRSVRASERPHRQARLRMNTPGMKSWVALAVVAVLLAVLPLLGSNYFLRIATTVCMYAVMAQSWNFIGGLAGYPSFATAAFFGFGAYTSAILQNHGAPMVLAWGSAGLAALLFAAFLGGAILHLRGHYFAIASLIIAEMLREIVNTLPEFTGGGKGLNLPFLRISVTAQAQFFFYAMLALAILCTGAAIVIHRSKLGFGLRCIQQNEDAASIMGVNTYGYKTAAFCLSAVFVGVAGAIYASWVNYIDPPDVFDVLLAIKPMVMVLLGGLGTIFGPALGAVILLSFEELVWRSFLTVHAAALGFIIVVLVLFLPNGILALIRERFPGSKTAT